MRLCESIRKKRGIWAQPYNSAIMDAFLNMQEAFMDSHIYGLLDPTTQQIKYVGRTIQSLEQRLKDHIWTSRRKSQCAKARWIRSLLGIGFQPEIFEIETVPLEQSPEAEGAWIGYFRYIGAILLNEQSHNVGGAKSYVVEWTDERIAKLGTIPDEEYAQELGVDRKTVEYKRKRLGLPKCGMRPEKKSPPPPMGGWNRIELPDHIITRLGTIADKQLGQEIGVSKYVIQRARDMRGIPPWTEENNHPTRYHAGHRPTRWDKEGAVTQISENLLPYLGKVSDTELAEIAGVNHSVIRRIRKEHGIPARSRKGNPKRKKGGRSLCLE